MAPTKKGGLMRNLTVGEDFRIGVNLAMKKFRNSEDDKGITVVRKVAIVTLFMSSDQMLADNRSTKNGLG
jgi:hypothetical protein